MQRGKRNEQARVIELNGLSDKFRCSDEVSRCRPGRITTSDRGSAQADLESALDTESDLHPELTQIIPVRVGGI